MSAIDPRTRRWLNDFLDNAHAVNRLTARGKSAYDSDEMLRYAGENLLIRLGECASRIDRHDTAFVNDHPDLELRRVKDTRNFVAHGYDVVDSEIVWAILSTNIPIVGAGVRELLDSRP